MTPRAPAGETPESPEQANKGIAGLPLKPEHSNPSAHADPRKAGVPARGLSAVAAAPSPSPGRPRKHRYKHKRYGVWEDPRQSRSQGPYCDHAEWIMAGSDPFHVPNGKQTTGGVDSGHHCRTYTRHIPPFCVFKRSPYPVFVTIFKNALSLG